MSDSGDDATKIIERETQRLTQPRECQVYTYFIEGVGYGTADARNISHCLEQMEEQHGAEKVVSYVIKLPVEHLAPGSALYRGNLSLIETLDVEIAKAAKSTATEKQKKTVKA